MKLEQLQNKKILIVGFGTEGKSTYEFLKRYFPNQEIGIADQKDGQDYLYKQNEYDLAIKSPGIQKGKVTIPYTTATNIFFANVKGTTIGITGSKGKSTTSAVLHAILKHAGKKAHLVGNITHKHDPIGMPLLTGLLQSNEKDDMWVCELSSFMLDDILYSPHISVITSFFPEHMDHHGSVDQYWHAKKQILAYAKPNDFYVYNQKFNELKQLAKETKAKAIPSTNTLPVKESAISLAGQHNFDNIKIAVTAAKLLHISQENIISAITNFTPLPHRLERVGTFQDITFYDDAISTTPESAIQAIETLKNIGTIFLGGQDRGFDFSCLAKVIVERTITNLVLFPDSGEKIYSEICKLSKKHFHILRTADMGEAVRFAFEQTPKGTICLLSTASPSYSVWENFEEKGNLFKQFIKQFGQEE